MIAMWNVTHSPRNAVELIVAIIALAKGKVILVQTSLVGSILSNLLLVMGMCFLFGGLRRPEQHFNTTVAQTATSLLATALAGVIVPTVWQLSSASTDGSIAKISRGTAVILLFVYCGYLLFQLRTHRLAFDKESPKTPIKGHLKKGAIPKNIARAGGIWVAAMVDSEEIRPNLLDPSEQEITEEPQLHFAVALGTLIVSTAVIGLCSEFMVDAIGAVVAGGTISEGFVGLILLPIVGNAAEHATAVSVAIKDKMDLALTIAAGSSLQVALFLLPLLVIIGWIIGNDDMTLGLDIFQLSLLFVSVLLVNYLLADSKSHWLEGLVLCSLYLIIAVCSWCR